MKDLLVSIHDMMKQIVATQQANTIIASSIPSSSSSSAPDSYGTPQASPLSESAPSSYSSPVTSGASNSASSGYTGPSSSALPPTSGSTNTYSSPSSSSSFRQPSSAPSGYISPSVLSSSAPDSYGTAQSSVISGSTSSLDDPVILSTYQQLNTLLRTYRNIQKAELNRGKVRSETETVFILLSIYLIKLKNISEKKPVVFPQKPSFNDILVMLERRALEVRRNKSQQTGIQSRSFTELQDDDEESEELPSIVIESFF